MLLKNEQNTFCLSAKIVQKSFAYYKKTVELLYRFLRKILLWKVRLCFDSVGYEFKQIVDNQSCKR